MYVSLRTEIKRRAERNEPQRFVFHGNGLFGLKDLAGPPIPVKTKTALEEVRESRGRACQLLFEQLTKGNHGSEFETMVSDLLLEMGYQNVNVIGGSDDHGVDIICEKREGVMVERFAIQCKCKSLNNKIGPKDISTLRDNLSTYQCQKGILITTSELNKDAKEKAKESGKEPIHYIERDETLDLFAAHGIGIKSETLKYFELDSSEYAFLKSRAG
jgi:restriction endonuclease Mrr